MTRLISWVILTIPFQTEFILCQDLKSIFHIPSRRNYDELEILERSNFAEAPSTPSTTSTSSNSGIGAPKSYANAQVMLRFGSDCENRKCKCGETCTCKNRPYYVPVPTPLPCYCAPPVYYPSIKPIYVLPHHLYQPPQCITPPLTPPNYAIVAYPKPQYIETPPIQTFTAPKFPQPNLYQPIPLNPSLPSCPLPQCNIEPRLQPLSGCVAPKNEKLEPQNEDSQVMTTQNENLVNEKIEENDSGSNNHPEILDTVELTDNSINARPSQKNLASDSPNLKLVSYQPKSTQISPNVLQNCLIPYNHPKLTKTKLLLSYPIFESPNQPTTLVESQSGCSVSEGSGFYSDPQKTIVYQKPTQLEIIPPQTTVVENGQVKKYIEVPYIRTQFVSPSHNEDCECCSCNKYIGELNQFEKA